MNRFTPRIDPPVHDRWTTRVAAGRCTSWPAFANGAATTSWQRAAGADATPTSDWHNLDSKATPLMRILVVEDDPDIQAAVVEVLLDQGYAVSTAHSVEDAMRSADESPPDLVLLDLWLSASDGASFVHEYRNRQPAPEHLAPIVAFTALPDGAERAAALQLDAVLTKPFHLAQLLSLVGRFAQGVPPPKGAPPAR